MESPCISLLSIFELKKNQGSQSGGFGKYKFKNFKSEKKSLQFQRLKGTGFGVSKEKLSLEMMLKNCLLSENDIKELKLNVVLYNFSLIDILLKKTLVKTVQKNYKAQSVKRI